MRRQRSIGGMLTSAGFDLIEMIGVGMKAQVASPRRSRWRGVAVGVAPRRIRRRRDLNDVDAAADVRVASLDIVEASTMSADGAISDIVDGVVSCGGDKVAAGQKQRQEEEERVTKFKERMDA